ncbi:MAG: hypothetical protein UU15_C0041G0001, partial [Candidatus Levybacteria bacterium GW2011_GWC2_40_7]
WQTIENYTPKVVIIEFNPSIPVDIEYIQPKDLSINQGSSLLSITKLARQKGYELIATTKWNAIFTRKKYFKLFRIKDNSPVAIYRIRQYQTQIFQLFDGTIKIVGNTSMLWHGVQMDNPQAIKAVPSNNELSQKNRLSFLDGFHKEYLPSFIPSNNLSQFQKSVYRQNHSPTTK